MQTTYVSQIETLGSVSNVQFKLRCISGVGLN